MIHILNNLPKEYDVIFDGLENRLTSDGDDTLIIEVMREKMSNRYEKIKNENEEKKENGKRL